MFNHRQDSMQNIQAIDHYHTSQIAQHILRPVYGIPAFADLSYGCNSVDFGVSIRHGIAFVSRGKCNFFTKVKNTFPYQPDAIIIINNKQYNDIPRISYHSCKSIVFHDRLESTKEVGQRYTDLYF